jgi:hypothetical protein
MLSVRRASCRPAAAALATAVLSVLLLAAGQGQASAQPTICWNEESGDLSYGCSEESGGGDGQDGGSGGDQDGGSGGPSCDMNRTEMYAGAERWCEGQNACWANVPSAVYPTPDTWPEEPPTEDSVYIFKVCYGPDGTAVFQDWTWYVPDQPSIEELARRAYGALQAPRFELAFSPPGESVVFIDTWWWAEGAPSGNLTGSAALGVVAVAEPSHLEVDPGDGSGVMTCDIVTSESDACSHVYQRASGGDGYAARARLVYDVHFEQNGDPIEVAGMPETFESGWTEASVPVTEIQASVIR